MYLTWKIQTYIGVHQNGNYKNLMNKLTFNLGFSIADFKWEHAKSKQLKTYSTCALMSEVISSSLWRNWMKINWKNMRPENKNTEKEATTYLRVHVLHYTTWKYVLHLHTSMHYILVCNSCFRKTSIGPHNELNLKMQDQHSTALISQPT